MQLGGQGLNFGSFIAHHKQWTYNTFSECWELASVSAWQAVEENSFWWLFISLNFLKSPLFCGPAPQLMGHQYIWNNMIHSCQASPSPERMSWTKVYFEPPNLFDLHGTTCVPQTSIEPQVSLPALSERRGYFIQSGIPLGWVSMCATWPSAIHENQKFGTLCWF